MRPPATAIFSAARAGLLALLLFWAPAPPAGASGPAFVDLDPIVLPVIEHGDAPRQVGVRLTLELAPGQSAASIAPKEPKLRDAFIRELHTLFSARSRTGRVADETLLKQRLLAVAGRVLGTSVVHAVLIRQLIEEPQ